jgi:GTP cyclohydrolase I
VSDIQDHVRGILVAIGEDPLRPGLARTPERVSKAYEFMMQGYSQTVSSVIGGGIFQEGHKNMVLVRDIEFYSMCEHHMLPFFGKAHVGYIPDGKIVGLSKMARVVDLFARRLQVQERMTDQIADALEEELKPRGVGIVLEAQHLCMMMRGVQKQGSSTSTSSLRGDFLSDPRTREEFLGLVHAAR